MGDRRLETDGVCKRIALGVMAADAGQLRWDGAPIGARVRLRDALRRA